MIQSWSGIFEGQGSGFISHYVWKLRGQWPNEALEVKSAMLMHYVKGEALITPWEMEVEVLAVWSDCWKSEKRREGK